MARGYLNSNDIGTQVYANPRDREVFAYELAAHGVILDYEVELRRRDGQSVWVSTGAIAVRDAAGTIAAYHGAMTDITERVRSTLMRDTVSAVVRLAVTSDSADGFRQALPALLSTRLGYPIVAVETYDAARAEMIFAGSVGIPAAAGSLSVPVGETLSGQVATRGEALVETAADARPEYAFAPLQALGVVTFVCAPMTLGTRVLGTLALADTRRRPDAAWVIDILRTVADTAADAIGRLETQAALQKNRDLLNAMGRMARVGGWEFDVAAGQLVWTETIYDIHELDQAYTPTVEQGIAFYTPESRPIIAEAVRRAIDLGEPFDLELEIVTAKGHRRWVHAIGQAVREGSRTSAVSGTFQDITERKQAEAELDRHRHHLEALVEARTQALNAQLTRVREQEHLLIHQARHAAMGEMLGNIAHQWRQPLSALALVLGNLQDAERHRELTPGYLARKIADAHRLIDKMSTTISDFRDFFRPDKPSETFDVSQSVSAALALMDASLKTHGIAVVTDFCAEARTTGRLNEYSQVILNLLGNAKDAILAHHPDGGKIVVRVDRDGDRARVRVADDGGGIAEAARERLFEPYFSTKPDGTGIGLYMSKMIVEKGMGGRISACNLEAGAEFTVATPLAAQDQ